MKKRKEAMSKEAIAMAVLDTKLDTVKETTNEIKELLKVQNGRIRKLENWRNYVAGIIFILSLLIGWLGSQAVKNFEMVQKLSQIHHSDLK